VLSSVDTKLSTKVTNPIQKSLVFIELLWWVLSSADTKVFSNQGTKLIQALSLCLVSLPLSLSLWGFLCFLSFFMNNNSQLYSPWFSKFYKGSSHGEELFLEKFFLETSQTSSEQLMKFSLSSHIFRNIPQTGCCCWFEMFPIFNYCG
jgi:hypothetical protein